MSSGASIQLAMSYIDFVDSGGYAKKVLCGKNDSIESRVSKNNRLRSDH